MKSQMNQFNFRIENELKIISLLQKGERSLNYLSQHSSISFTAVSNIVDELIEYGILEKVIQKEKQKKRGRIPELARINIAKGLTCAIDLSAQDLLITLNDLTGNIVVKKVIDNVYFVDDDMLNVITNTIYDLLKTQEANNRPLVNICIASPGLVYKNSGEIYRSFRVSASKNVSLINYFFNKFGVPTYLYNDVKISCLGEMSGGYVPNGAKNFLFFHIGNDVGASIVIDGKIYQGKDGFSGEFTTINDKDDNSISSNRVFGLKDICLIANEIDPSLKLFESQFKIDYNNLLKAYNESNEALLKGIDEIAKKDALQIIAYNDFLDMEYIIIEGPILLLKECFKSSLLKYVQQYDSTEFRAKIVFSSSEGMSSLIGTISQATNLYFLNLLEEMTHKRAGQEKYNIFDFFGDKI